MVTVGWILAREFIKLYVARQANRLGSRIRTKLVVGAMLLSCVPVFFLVLWSYEVLNYNLKAWFTNPVDNQVESLQEGGASAGPGDPGPACGCRPRCWPRSRKPRQLLAGGPARTRTRWSVSPRSRGCESVADSRACPALRSKPGDRTRQRAQDGRIAVVHDRCCGTARIELAARIPLDAGQQLHGDQEIQRRVGADRRQPQGLPHALHHADGR